MYFPAHIHSALGGRSEWHCLSSLAQKELYAEELTHQTNIHSCRSFPWESCFGQTSRKRYMSFFNGFDLLGMTNRIMCIRSPAWGSPLSIMDNIFFCRIVRSQVERCICSPLGRSRTIVSILDSSVPFSRACLSSFWEGTSAALSWWTYIPVQSLSRMIIAAAALVPDCTNSQERWPWF